MPCGVVLLNQSVPTIIALEPLSLGHANVPSLPVTTVSNLILDSGAGIHLLNPKDASSQVPTFQAQELKLDTANGVISSDLVAQVQIPLGPLEQIDAEVRILRNSPSVLSLGRLCCDSGYGFAWAPFSDPLLFTPSGHAYSVPQHQYVPVLNQVREVTSDDSAHRIGQILNLLEARTPAGPATVEKVLSIAEQYEQFARLHLPSDCLLIECCADTASQFGQRAHVFGFFVIRVCQHHDLHSRETVAMLHGIISHNKGCSIHGSLPCTPWSRFQALCLHNSTDKDIRVVLS